MYPRRIYNYEVHLTSDEILEILKQHGTERLTNNNGLTLRENSYLFEGATINEVIGWTLSGLARLRYREEPNNK